MIYCQVKARLDKVQEDGSLKQVSEVYLVETDCFGVAERTVQEYIAPTASGDFDIVAIARKNYAEVLRGQEDAAEKWFHCKLNLVTLDEKSGREKKSPFDLLVNADTAMDAHKRVDEHMKGSISDYIVEKVEETKILEVFAEK
ncbi:DUF4494 domain-containing protein [Porphyromonas gingivalis]|uniref:DUF4494 domain-containing protein n=2 Tax=root TaxID=1 RepID=A0AAE9XI13_PORGN|nr:DUF4494 domain-containing protein [Porphyromonas gingivalis]WCG02604.1 DUF4494 domain-containing protein [Porphyromonas gingivalis]SJL29156.1 hypothetical protein PGIN_ATCC49417_00860 [Porphyromonas gingivalis]